MHKSGIDERGGQNRSKAALLGSTTWMTVLVLMASVPDAAARDWQEHLRQIERGATPIAQLDGFQLAQAGQTIDFAIPAQNLNSAVLAFAKAAGVQVFYDVEKLQGLSTGGIQGTYTPEHALRLLLAGTGITYRFTNANTVKLEQMAAGSLDGSIRLEPITVTGEKTSRTLLNTASSVSVLTDEDIEEVPGAASFDDIVRRMPNVVDTGTGNFAPTIRGIDATGPANGVFAFLGGVRPRVTIQQDGRALTFNELIYGRTGLWDAERVEVFRGPQTTVQGRNSIAGAIVVDTKDPTFEHETNAQAVVGNYGTRQVSGVVSGPIVEDQVAVRLSADQRYHRSWVDVTGDVGVDDPEKEKATNLRGKLLLLPNSLPDLSAKLTVNHIDTRRPQTELVEQPFENRENSGADTFPVFENEVNSGILNLDYALTSTVELRNTATYSDVAVNRLTSAGNGIAEILSNEFSEELVAEYKSDGLRGILGAYYFTAHSDEEIDIGGGVFEDRTDTAAIFSEGTITFLDKLDLTLGARYEREKRKRLGSAGVFAIDLDETFDAFLPKVGLAYRPNERFTVGTTVQRGFNAGGAGVAFVAPFPSFTYDEEFVWNYEGFFRSRWLDDRLTVDGNIFYADYKNQQRLAFLVPGDPSSGVIRNAESTKSYGAELTATWLPARGLELFGTLGLLKTEIEEFPASVQDLTGNEFARAPDVTLSFGAQYRLPSGLSVGFDGRYVGAYFSDDDNDPTEKIDPHFLLNAQIAYEIENLRLFAYATNLFNRDDELLLFDGNAQLVDPREYGIGLKVRF